MENKKQCLAPESLWNKPDYYENIIRVKKSLKIGIAKKQSPNRVREKVDFDSKIGNHIPLNVREAAAKPTGFLTTRKLQSRKSNNEDLAVHFKQLGMIAHKRNSGSSNQTGQDSQRTNTPTF